jgi:hypothetical protein
MTMTAPDPRPEPSVEPGPTTYERLAEPFDLEAHATVNKGGHDQTYVPWTDYVERLNDVLGPSGWSSRVLREGFTATECWVLVEIEATIDGERVVRQQYGCEPIVKGRDAKPTTDLLKSTASDAVKKAASLLGVGLYLSVKEERVAIQQAMREAVLEEVGRRRGEAPDRDRGPAPAPLRPAPSPQPAPAPLDASARTALEHKYEALREQARSRGFQASWVGNASSAWNDLQLPKYVGLLENYLARNRGAA